MDLDQIQAAIGKKLFDHQIDALAEFHAQLMVDQKQPRMLIHHPPGKGKSISSLACLAFGGFTEAVVIAPPITKKDWLRQGHLLGITIQFMSHAKFRQKQTKLRRDVAVVADEFHLFGGHIGVGWKKFDTMARHLQAPIIMMSATPNYNVAERVYCIEHILDPHGTKGGYLAWLYQHCDTEQNYFGITPKVLGFKNYSGDDAAAQYLSTLDGVVFEPDELSYSILDHEIQEKIPEEMARFGYNRRRHRVIGSQIEERHTRINLSLVTEEGLLEQDATDELVQILSALPEGGTALIFANHSSVAEAAATQLADRYVVELLTGKTPPRTKAQIVDQFKRCELDVLVGTATLATGLDGLDKVCDTLIILDDTDDDSLRRQVVGRIMPRGEDTDASKKQVHRLVLS